MEEFVEIDLDSAGNLVAPKHDKIALIDADTIAYIACSNTEVQESLLPRDFYSDAEWEELTLDPSFDIDNMCIWTINAEMALGKAEEKIQKIFDRTGCQSAELYFTDGRKNFRYQVKKDYKANRTGRVPTGLIVIKLALLAKYPGQLCTAFEADDIVVWKKKQDPEKYIMCAVDKDLLYSLAGTHFNYYESTKYDIDMKWLEVDHITSIKWPYMQCLVGDKTDNIEGVPKIGPKKAEQALSNLCTHEELWQAVVEAYERAGKTYDDAVQTMRLVNMHQFNGTEIELWHP